MPKAKRNAPLYRRGAYSLDWDRRKDGSLRSPFLAVFWYDASKRRIRSASTGTENVSAAKRFLDAHYLKNDAGQLVCPTCGQVRRTETSYLVTEAIEGYLAAVEGDRDSEKAIRSRLAMVLAYIATLPDPNIQAVAIDRNWIEKFRKWAAKQPRLSPTGKELPKRSLSTVETYVAQLAAAINWAHGNNKILTKANFKPLQFKEVNRTPEHRSDIEELAAMFCYAQGYPALHRFLAISVATLCRPDAAHDFNVAEQWKRSIELNPPGRRQTKKYRPKVPAVRQIIPALKGTEGWFVGVKSVRRQWERMAEFIDLPGEGEAGMKLVRRSMAKLVRDRLHVSEWAELEIFLGHRKFDEISALYAPDRPDYLAKARAVIEGIIDEIEVFVPLAFTGLAPEKEVARELEPC